MPEATEFALLTASAEHRGLGEWFDGTALRRRAVDAGGWRELLLGILGPGDWNIEVHEPPAPT